MDLIKDIGQILQLIVESAPNALLVINGEGKIVFVNAYSEKLFGYTRLELKAQNVEVLIPIRFRQDHVGLRNSFIQHPQARPMGAGRELFAVKKDGTEIPVEVALTPLATTEPGFTLVTITDISLRKKAEKELDNSEQRFRTLFENAPEGIVVLDLIKNRYCAYNTSAIKLLKYTGEQLVEMVPGTLSPALQPDGAKSIEKIASIIEQVLKGTSTIFEWEFLDGTGNPLLCELRLSVLPETGQTKILASFVDIFERKQSEKQIKELNEHLEERVLQRTAELTEVNRALEGFSYSVSHDLRAPLRGILGFTNIIQQEFGPAMSEELRRLFAHVEGNAKRMNHIIDDLLTLAKYGREKLHLMPVDMNQLVQSVWQSIKENEHNCAELKVEELPVITADGSMLEQVVVNLLSNAVKYSAKKEKPLVQFDFENERDRTTFYVKDNGVGFDMVQYNRLFTAFQRLHNMSDFEGTGVGLVLVKRIIEKHGGMVGAESAPGQGATFWFSLPKTAGATLN